MRESILRIETEPSIFKTVGVGEKNYGLVGEEAFRKLIHNKASDTFDLGFFCKERTGVEILEEGGIDALFFKKSRGHLTFLACEVKTQIAESYSNQKQEKRADLHREGGDQMSPAWLEPRIYGTNPKATGFSGSGLLVRLKNALEEAQKKDDAEAVFIIKQAQIAFDFKGHDGVLSFKSFVVKIKPTRTGDCYFIIQLDFRRDEPEADKAEYHPSREDFDRLKSEVGTTYSSRFISHLFGI